MEEHLPEAEASMMDAAHLSDSRGYDLMWASNIVKRAWQHLQNAFEAEGKAEWLEVLRPFVDGTERTPPNQQERSEERRVGKEGRIQGSQDSVKKMMYVFTECGTA